MRTNLFYFSSIVVIVSIVSILLSVYITFVVLLFTFPYLFSVYITIVVILSIVFILHAVISRSTASKCRGGKTKGEFRGQ